MCIMHTLTSLAKTLSFSSNLLMPSVLIHCWRGISNDILSYTLHQSPTVSLPISGKHGKWLRNGHVECFAAALLGFKGSHQSRSGTNPSAKSMGKETQKRSEQFVSIRLQISPEMCTVFWIQRETAATSASELPVSLPPLCLLDLDNSNDQTRVRST